MGNHPSVRRQHGLPVAMALMAAAVACCPTLATAAGFSHQSYNGDVADDRYEIVQAPQQVNAALAFDQFNRMLAQRRIARLWLIHGTFGGDDGFGLLSLAADRAPGLLTLLGMSGDDLRNLNKGWKDNLLGVDAFNGAYAAEFNRHLNRVDFVDGSFVWGSENNHLDRAHAAVRLLHRLLETKLPPDQGIMLWGHSHAGNVFALMSHLLANDPAAREKFFEIGHAIYPDDAAWKAVYRELAATAGPHPLAKRIDIVTFGTPIRYAWNEAGYRSLLHFVYHRSDDQLALEEPPHRTRVLAGFRDILSARYGDWVQSFAIDGTDNPPVNFDRWEANAAYARLFGAFPAPPEVNRPLANALYWPRRIAYLQRCWGARVSAQGFTLLVDYGDDANELLGHGVYMKQAWLPYHAAEVAKRLSAETVAGNRP